ncbi:MAG TPA: hypothetical protein P5154_03610 [Candidatus Izemoplasmatales bacterium]|nr:hypothetical protein [Candidatus Izemoplasmatales bacterium]
MKNFFRRMFNTEFLPMSEVRKIKITLVMFFLLVITAVTIPFSIFFDYPPIVKILASIGLALAFVLILLLIRWNKIMFAVQVSIVYTIALTIFYIGGTGSFYAYLFFYIALTIIIFFQELYSYLTFGTLVVGLGTYYLFRHQADLVLIERIPGEFYVYVVILVVFYLIFLVQILYNEKLYIDLNYDWVKMNHLIEKYQDNSLSYLVELDRRNGKQPAYEDIRFQRAVGEIAVFLCEQFKENGKEILNVRDLYLYIHERGLKRILDNDEFSVATKKIANRLDKYLLNNRTDMVTMIFNFQTKFRETVPYRDNRYEYALDRIALGREEQIIALAMIYQYLASEVTRRDEWDPIGHPLTHQDIVKLMTALETDEFLTPELIAVFRDNADLFQQYLGKKS